MKSIKYTLVFAVAALAAAACVYDFEPEDVIQTTFTVIEGDILAGDYTTVKVSSSKTLDDKSKTITYLPSDVYVESSTGEKFQGSADVAGNSYLVDTRNIDLSKQYRLVVKTKSDNRVYSSSWQEVLKAAPIDSITYSIASDRKTMDIYVSTHSDSSCKYYRWTGHEVWEYTAPFYAYYYFYKATYVTNDEIRQFKNGENRYYCWNEDDVSEFMFASTEDLSANVIDRHRLYSIANTELKISYLYSVELLQEAISEEAYRYYDLLYRNSEDVGSLFSPQPSECRGNIICESDPSITVLGYISASTVSRMRKYINNRETHFYVNPDKATYNEEPIVVDRSQWRSYYKNGFDIFDMTEDSKHSSSNVEYTWLPLRCIDCEVWGKGTKTKPDFWPNDDK